MELWACATWAHDVPCWVRKTLRRKHGPVSVSRTAGQHRSLRPDRHTDWHGWKFVNVAVNVPSTPLNEPMNVPVPFAEFVVPTTTVI